MGGGWRGGRRRDKDGKVFGCSGIPGAPSSSASGVMRLEPNGERALPAVESKI